MNTRVQSLVVLTILAAAAAADAAEFSADLVKSEGLMVTKGRVLVRGEKYRMEIQELAGPNVVVLVDPAADVTRVLVPRYKLYLEVKCSSSMSRMNDPFQAAAFMSGHFDLKVAGTEEIGGHACEKRLYEYSGQAAMAIWFSKELGFALRIEMLQQEDHFTVLENLKAEPVGEALFGLPEGYEKSDRKTLIERVDADPEMKAKQEAYEARRPRKVEINRMLRPGDETRVLLGALLKARAKVEYGSDEPFEWYAVPHRAGKPQMDRSKCLHEGEAKVDFADEPLPDMIVVGATKGGPSLSLELVGRLPLMLAISDRFRLGRGSGKSWGVKVRGAAVRVTFTAGKDGARGDFSVTKGAGKDRKSDRHELQLGAGEARTFEFASEDGVRDLDLRMAQGEVAVEHVEDGRPPEQRKPF